jgi:type IV pilus assembly protein PilW
MMSTDNRGFTLVELMVTLAMAGIIIAAVYTTYTIQQKTYTAQDQVIEMQQNIRAAITTMVQELRMAGYDPTTTAHCTIVGPTAPATAVSSIRFQQDITDAAGTAPDGDGTINPLSAPHNEDITYGFAAADDANGDGLVDNGSGFASLRRNSQPIAENIQAIEFLYTLEDGTTTTTPTTTDLSNSHTVTISILARAGQRDAKFINSTSYTPASGTVWDLNGAAAGTAPNDNYRRRLLIRTVQCRNMVI